VISLAVTRCTSVCNDDELVLCVQLDAEAASLLTELQQQLNVVLDELCTEFATRYTLYLSESEAKHLGA